MLKMLENARNVVKCGEMLVGTDNSWGHPMLSRTISEWPPQHGGAADRRFPPAWKALQK